MNITFNITEESTKFLEKNLLYETLHEIKNKGEQIFPHIKTIELNEKFVAEDIDDSLVEYKELTLLINDRKVLDYKIGNSNIKELWGTFIKDMMILAISSTAHLKVSNLRNIKDDLISPDFNTILKPTELIQPVESIKPLEPLDQPNKESELRLVEYFNDKGAYRGYFHDYASIDGEMYALIEDIKGFIKKVNLSEYELQFINK